MNHQKLVRGRFPKNRGIRVGRVTGFGRGGVRIELCGATAKAHRWGNADLLPGIRINTDAMARMTQLVQEGFVPITE